MKYLKDLEKEFWNGKKEQSYDSSALNDEDWVTYYNSFRDSLIGEEDYPVSYTHLDVYKRQGTGSEEIVSRCEACNRAFCGGWILLRY